MKQKNNLSHFSHFDNGRSKYQKTDFLFGEEFDSLWQLIFHKQKISFLKSFYSGESRKQLKYVYVAAIAFHSVFNLKISKLIP